MSKTMKKDIIEEYLKRASFLYLIGAILSIIIVLGGLVFYLIYIPQNIKEPEQEEAESLVEKQLKELDNLRQNTEPLTEEQIQEQLGELDDLGKGTKPLAEEEIQKQLEELENIRNK